MVNTAPLAFSAPAALFSLRHSRPHLSLRRTAPGTPLRACAAARSPAVSTGSASPFPPALAALVRSQLASPIFAFSSASLPAAARAAQAASPPAFLDDAALATSGGVAAAVLRDRRNEIISTARAAIFAAAPGIEDEGGALWPTFRADACWRDIENFLRVVQYGCVCDGGKAAWLSGEGCVIMAEIYRELEVPLKEMIVGLRAAAEFVGSELMVEGVAEADRDAAALAFADLVAMMHAMQRGGIKEWAETSERAVRGD